jgi:hypothetical protein
MTLDKLQLIATAVVPDPTKVRWLSWWNSSSLSREALHFPPKPVSDKDLEGWINKASFYAGVRSSKLQLQSVLYFISWPLRVGPAVIYEINFIINILALLVDHKPGIGTKRWVQLGLVSLGWLICIQFLFFSGPACRVQLALISDFFFILFIRTCLL